MKDITNSDAINCLTQSLSSGRVGKILELVALGELYMFSAGMIAFMVLFPAIMWIYGQWDWLFAIMCPVAGLIYWYLPFQEFQDRFKYSLVHIREI